MPSQALRAFVTLVVLLAVMTSARAYAEALSALRRDDRALELEQRLIAPCCWTQTLDVHDSELSTALRAEIHARLFQGEAPMAIEDDLAARFGERIRAVPRGNDTRKVVPVLVGCAMVLSLFGLLAFVRRGRRAFLAQVSVAQREDDRLDDARYDRALDAELKQNR